MREVLATVVALAAPHVDLGALKTGRNLPPERRALTGETLLVRYCEADQEPGIAAQTASESE